MSCGNLNNCVMDIKAHTINNLLFSPGVLPKSTMPKEVLEDLRFCQEVVKTKLFDPRTPIKHTPAPEGSFILVEYYYFREKYS